MTLHFDLVKMGGFKNVLNFRKDSKCFVGKVTRKVIDLLMRVTDYSRGVFTLKRSSVLKQGVVPRL